MRQLFILEASSITRVFTVPLCDCFLQGRKIRSSSKKPYCRDAQKIDLGKPLGPEQTHRLPLSLFATWSLSSRCLCLSLHTCPAPLLLLVDEVDSHHRWSKFQREPVCSLGTVPAHQVTWWVTLSQVTLPHRTAWHCSLTPLGRTISGSQECWESRAWSLKCPVHSNNLLSHSVT